MKTQDYQATIYILQEVEELMAKYFGEESYSKSSKELATKIILEWSKSLKAKIKTVNPKKKDIKMQIFLEGFLKFLQ